MINIGDRVRFVSTELKINTRFGHGTVIDFVRACPIMSFAVVRWDDNSTERVFPFRLERV